MSSDEVDITSIPLSERIQSDKQIYLGTRSKTGSTKHAKNVKRKGSHQSRKQVQPLNTSSDDPWPIPETARSENSDLPPEQSKKRQNGDKIGHIATQSKRTCFSDRFLQPEWRNLHKRNGVVDHASHSDGAIQIKPLHGNSVASTKNSDVDIQPNRHPGVRYKSNMENSNTLSEMDGPSSSLGSSGSMSNDRAATHNGVEASSSVVDYTLSLPSTSRDGQAYIDTEDNLINNRTVNIIDSDSDVSPSLKVSSLKVGRQLPECLHRVKKVIGKRVQKILYSDDTSDESDWHSKYRRPVKCLSSASEDDGVAVPSRKKKLLKYSSSRISSSESNDEDVGNSMQYAVAHNTRRSTLKQQSSSSKRSDKSKRQLQITKCPLIPTCNAGGSGQSSRNDVDSPFLAIRNRFSRNGVWARSPVATHPRVHSSQRHTGLTRSSFNQIVGRERPRHRLSSQFPDIFDAEDSSDVEFFTARSYSDTETSTEYASNADANRTVQLSDHDYTTNSVAPGSSDDDEISIIFSANATAAVPNRESTIRRGRRGSGVRRRRTRGSSRTSSHAVAQDVPPVSPDPVAQVQQVEEDERFARLLQAEFDAEIDETATFISMTDSDEGAIIDPVGLDPPEVPLTLAAHQTFPCHPPPVLLRGRPRAGMHHNMVQVTGECRRRGRRSNQFPWMWQFARVLGFGPTSHHHHHHHHHHHEHEGNDYESLIRLTETVGEAVPRGLLKNEINRLPTRKFFIPGFASTSQASEEVVHKRADLNKECQVCLCDYENGDVLRILPCFHEFHTPCIDPWLKINHTCPVCRVEVVFDS